MKAFDKLPPTARAALANAVENWVPQPILTWHRRGRKGYVTGADIAKSVEGWNVKELAKREEQRAKAIGPYRGNVPDGRPQLRKRGSSARILPQATRHTSRRWISASRAT